MEKKRRYIQTYLYHSARHRKQTAQVRMSKINLVTSVFIKEHKEMLTRLS